MNIAIVEDMICDRKLLLDCIEKYAKENTISIDLAEYASGDEFFDKIDEFAPDAIFLDIYMDGMGGMDVAYEIRKRNLPCQIIFVTTSPEFAVQSYEVRAFYYVLKPYAYDDICRILAMLFNNIQKSLNYIKVKGGREWCKIILADILYIDYNNHYVQIHTKDAIISTYMKFGEMQDKLLTYSEFLNCYRCIVVNMDKIKKIDDMFFLLSNGEYIPINRKKSKEIKLLYTDYIFSGIEDKDVIDDSEGRTS